LVIACRNHLKEAIDEEWYELRVKSISNFGNRNNRIHIRQLSALIDLVQVQFVLNQRTDHQEHHVGDQDRNEDELLDFEPQEARLPLKHVRVASWNLRWE